MEDNPMTNLLIVPPLPTSVWVNHVMPFLPDRISFNRLQCTSRDIYSASKHLINTGKITPPWPKTSFQVGAGVHSVAFSPNGGLLASADRNIHILDSNYGRFVTLEGHTRSIQSVKFSPDGKILASVIGGARTTRLWSLADHSYRELGGYDEEGHGQTVIVIALSPDGACLASGGSEGRIHLWNVNDGTCTRIIRHVRLGYSIRSVAFSPDGRTLAAVGVCDGIICFWNLLNDGNNDMAATIVDAHGHTAVYDISYSLDGRYLASGGYDSIRLWNATDHSCVAILEGHAECVRSVSFSPNGKLLVSGSNDGSIRLWSVENKTCLLVLPNHHIGAVITSVAFTPNGQTLASGGSDRTVRLWNPREEKIRDKQYDWEKLIRLWNCKP
jgi:WD40 repeat protein